MGRRPSVERGKEREKAKQRRTLWEGDGRSGKTRRRMKMDEGEDGWW